jgi:DNA-binding GntR family transcriptional regulator
LTESAEFQSLTKTEAAYRTLRAAIESGLLPPRERLLIQVLQRRFSMSATPIREALRMLQADGLVVHTPHRGIVVAEFSAESTEEIFRLRAVLEPMATELAAAKVTEAGLEEVMAAHNRLVRADDGTLASAGASMDAAWHQTIYHSAGSPYLERFISRLWAALPVDALWSTSDAHQAVRQHEAITAALKARRSALAKELMRQHIVIQAAKVRSTAARG